jgi:hypothetical protein
MQKNEKAWTQIVKTICLQSFTFLTRNIRLSNSNFVQLWDPNRLYKLKYLINGLLCDAVNYNAIDAPVGCLHELQQRLLVQLPLAYKLAGLWILAAGQLERHLEAIRVHIVEVLHATRDIIPN